MRNVECRMQNAEYRDATLGSALFRILHSSFRIHNFAFFFVRIKTIDYFCILETHN